MSRSSCDKNVIVSIEELKKLLEEMNFPKEDNLEKINEFYDSIRKNTEEEEEKEIEIEIAFKVFDIDDDDFITCQDLELALDNLGLWKTRMDGSKMIQAYDTNSDSQIDLQEFKNMLKRTL